MYRILIAEMTIGTGDLGNSAQIIRPMTIGTGLHIGLGRRHVAGRHPTGGVRAGILIEVGLRIGIPASGQQKDQKQ